MAPVPCDRHQVNQHHARISRHRTHGAHVELNVASRVQRLSIWSVVALLLCTALWGAIFLRMADKAIGIDKDQLYLYVCGLEIKEPAAHDRQLELIRQLVSISASEHLIYRATMRAGYCNNYPFTSLSMYAAGEVERHLNIADPTKDFPKFISSSLWWGMTLSGAILGVLCLICVFWAARDALMLASFAAVGIAALLYVFVPSPNLSWMLHHAPPVKIVTLPNTLLLSLHSWLNPSPAFSPFSIFPRCLCAMLAFAAFTLRWSGREAAAYWVPIVVSFVHQSEAPILLAVMIWCHLLINPASLFRAACLVPICLNVLVIVLRERMLSLMGFPKLTILLVAAAIICLAILALGVPASRAALKAGWKIIDRWRERIYGRFSAPFTEAAIIFSLWLVVLLICYAFRRDTFPRVIYLWSELPSRYVGLFQLTVIAGLTYPVWLAVVRMGPRVNQAALGMASCVVVALALHQWTRPWNSPTEMINRARQTDELIAKGYPGEAGSYSRIETPWYYLILRQSYAGGEGLAEFFRKR